eukprot:CAMPEP_0172822788 /NCGR_PEP_ID=MMETSP1075-20121228/16871_1 /TAXON_ID=2916 /ORGANISM="Ceratium fusus, Strain PA161109" /LENGTH=56 /DNA_ID=CAMNT_0013663811 /DNA_START=55 /DNA_END=221 /DNA_ORIENTATION=+
MADQAVVEDFVQANVRQSVLSLSRLSAGFARLCCTRLCAGKGTAEAAAAAAAAAAA